MILMMNNGNTNTMSRMARRLYQILAPTMREKIWGMNLKMNPTTRL